MSNVSYHIACLLEKMQSSDKDFRFMATNDLMTELQKDSIKLDDDSERKVVRMLLKLLNDKNGEVQNLAVKCLGPLVNKVKDFQVETIVESLCTSMMSDKERLRDISSIGLKTVIAQLPQIPGGLSTNVCRKITGRLTAAIQRADDVSVQLEALDIINNLLTRFGTALISFHLAMMSALIPQLCSPRQAVCKRTISALSNLVVTCSSTHYNRIVEHLHTTLKMRVGNDLRRTYVQCVAAVCRHSGHKFGQHIESFVPMIQASMAVEDDELHEYCIQAFEAFVIRCPKEITPSIPAITKLCLTYITYDPNYNYDADDNRDMTELSDNEDDEENEEYSDDEDVSWKVRRAAAKCLEAIITTRHELISDFYRELSPALIVRFKEREENVKCDVFHAYISLIRQTKRPINKQSLKLDHLDDIDASTYEDTPFILLQRQVPQIVAAVVPQMRERSMKTRQCCFQLLKELCSVLSAPLTTHIPDLVPGILFSLTEKNTSSNMKIEALSFIYCLLTTHPPEVFHSYISTLLPPVIDAVRDSYYKIIAEALNVLQVLVKVIRPLDTDSVNPPFNFVPYVEDIYKWTLVRLKTADIDQEVKEKAIAAMGQIICNFGDHLTNELSVCLPLFLDRLRNEITRLTTVKALTKIAGSPLHLPFPILQGAISTLALFLRKNQRALKLNTLQLLNTLLQNYHYQIEIHGLYVVIAELPPLLNESDLQVAQWTLSILTSIADLTPFALHDLSNNNILPPVLTLLKSPLLQGCALNSMLAFFRSVAKAHLPNLSCRDLLHILVLPINQNSANASGDNSTSSHGVLHKQAFYSFAKCVAVVTVTYESQAVVVPKFINDKSNMTNDSHKMFTLLVVGEIGREIDLSFIDNLNAVILDCFSSPSEEIKSAASYALGGICVGNLPHYLPFILQQCQLQPKHQYLLLHSLKEAITCLSGSSEGIDQLVPYIPAIWDQLFRHCESHEEGTRNAVAECLGKLTLLNPETLLVKLKSHLKSTSPLMRTTVVTAFKFTISDKPSAIDPLMRQHIGQFLDAMKDPELQVRRVALIAFNSAAHNKPSLIREFLDTTLPQLYAETKIKKELIREVQMGPFKHTVDDGLDLRKAAFECMYTLLDSCLDRIDIFQFINHVESGLKDHYDIKMLTYLIVTRLTHICPGAVLQCVERIIEPLKATCNMKVKANSVKQEYGKQDELKRSALRVVTALLSIPDADKNSHLIDFLNHIRTSDILPLFESVQKDSHNATVINDNTMDQS